MEEIIKSYLSLFFLLLTVVLGLSFVSAVITARNAEISMEKYVMMIEASNLADSVVDSCKEDARERFGSEDNAEVLQYTSYGTGDYKYGSLDLAYQFQIPLLGINSTHHIVSDVN